ncbi:hypothetical protein HPB48_018634 [Haemaphysalis longicornis]|uniref:Uncharacterized protein n=1 Tax=Haemaphysalis longicornis TaxID=44386 RepID=A0A9J6GG04_HAELO|nr:hypothetical protein HPB48_018634 [Haemaphysalis longicornis]
MRISLGVSARIERHKRRIAAPCKRASLLCAACIRFARKGKGHRLETRRRRTAKRLGGSSAAAAAAAAMERTRTGVAGGGERGGRNGGSRSFAAAADESEVGRARESGRTLGEEKARSLALCAWGFLFPLSLFLALRQRLQSKTPRSRVPIGPLRSRDCPCRVSAAAPCPLCCRMHAAAGEPRAHFHSRSGRGRNQGPSSSLRLLFEQPSFLGTGESRPLRQTTAAATAARPGRPHINIHLFLPSAPPTPPFHPRPYSFPLFFSFVTF